VSLRAGVIEEGWWPSTAQAIAFLLQQSPSREAVKAAERLGRLPSLRSTFERVGHAVGAVQVHHHPGAGHEARRHRGGSEEKAAAGAMNKPSKRLLVWSGGNRTSPDSSVSVR
jgi:hypothetical protein